MFLQAFTNEFAALITQVLYTQPSLRPTLLRSLQTLVETSRSLSTSSAPAAELLSSFGLDQAAGVRNLAFLKSMAKNLLAVLFNVFSQVGREQRGMVGEVITSYLGVTSEPDINATYTKVVTHLGQALMVPFNKASSGAGPGQASPTSHTMLDLLILLVPFLPKESAQALFAHATGEKLIGSDDPAVQKKSYRVLARLIETKKVLVGGEGIEAFVKRLADGGEVVAAAARRVSLTYRTRWPSSSSQADWTLRCVHCRIEFFFSPSSFQSSLPINFILSPRSSLRPFWPPRRSTKRHETPLLILLSSWVTRCLREESSREVSLMAWRKTRWLMVSVFFLSLIYQYSN